MANPKYELTVTCKSPRSPQSAEEMSKETKDALEDTQSIKSMNSNFFDKVEYGDQNNCMNSNIKTDNFVTTKLIPSDSVDQILTGGTAQTIDGNESFDLNSEISESLCSQCKFANRFKNYIERGIDTSVEMEKEFQKYFVISQTNNLSPMMIKTIDESKSACGGKAKSLVACLSPSILNLSNPSTCLQNTSFSPDEAPDLVSEPNLPKISEQYLDETEKTQLNLDQSPRKNSGEICNGKSSKDQVTCKWSRIMSWNSESCLAELISSKKIHLYSLRKFKSEDNIPAKLAARPDKFMSNLIEGFELIPSTKGNHFMEITKCNENVSNADILRQKENKCSDDWNNDKVNTGNSTQVCVLRRTSLEKLEGIIQGELDTDIEQIYKTSEITSVESGDIFLEQLTPSQNLKAQDIFTEDSSSTFDQSTIEEVYFMDSNDNIDCSNINEKFQTFPQHKTDGNDSLQCILNDKLIEDTRTTEKLIDSNLQQLANSINQPIYDESKKSNITVNKDSDSVVATIDSKTVNNEIQSSPTDPTLKPLTHLSVIQLEVLQIEEETIVKTIDLVNPIDDPETNSESLRDQQLGSEKGLGISSNSFLELSIESRMDNIEEKDTLRMRENILIHANNNITTSFTTSQNSSEENEETKNRELAVLNTDNTNAGGEIINSPDNVNTDFLIMKKLKRIETEDERTLDKGRPSNLTNNVFPNFVSTRDENICSKNIQTPPGDFSLDMLSESQLQTIETEAYAKSEEISVVRSKEKATIEGCVNEQNIFFQPEQIDVTVEKIDPVLPNWVTNRAPEPDYEKMRRTFQKRRQYVKILLEEILRLSTIVSKVGAMLRAEHTENNSKSHVESVFQHQDFDSVHQVDKRLDDRCNESTVRKTPSNTRTNVQTASNAVKEPTSKDIFYVPPSNMMFPNIPKKFPKNVKNLSNSFKPSINTVTPENRARTDETAGLKSEKFYVPPSNKSKYDTLPTVNQKIDTKFKDGEITEAFARYNASIMFGALKQSSKNHKTYKPDIRTVWHSGHESDNIPEKSFSRNKFPKNNQTVRQQIAAEYEMPQSNLNTSVFTNNTVANNFEEAKSNIRNLDHSNPANKNTIFYVPDKWSSMSSDYIGLGSIKNDPSRSNKFPMPSTSQIRSNEHSKLLVNDKLAMNTQKVQSNGKNLENLPLAVKKDIFYSPGESSMSNSTLFTSKSAESGGTKNYLNLSNHADFPMPSTSHLRPDRHLRISNNNVVVSNTLKRKNNIHDVKNAKRARENTIFYSPEKLSLPSKDLLFTSDYTEIRNTTNPSLSSYDYSLPSARVRLERPPRLLNNTAVFYNGNKDH